MRVIVWGNCQAAPLGDLLRAPLARAGLDVVDLPPVYLLTRDEVSDVHALMPDVALLVSQPIRDEYRVPGCATSTLAGLLPPDGRLVTVPLVYYSGALPYQVTANGADGLRVNAPLTDYHDLRLLQAADRGETATDVLAGWPRAAPDDALRAHAAASLAELHRRERTCDVVVSDLVTAPDALFTLNHPNNAVLGETARRVLGAFGGDPASVAVPLREYLGGIRAPVEVGAPWLIAGEPVPWDVVITEHLAWYRTRPDVVRDGLDRNARRLADLYPR
ncbi:WcbI family polysaccharide biosynthesis putative acetyltransferase [uncultured Jatrophihabitans sp.]|uniref:WcbI family polysaccharide biosynthesis putative acetyltransferase n=1 Tax=uncultured Jatrophihabitans sp. TaxID=1610747 RepID=UPI0035CBFBAA